MTCANAFFYRMNMAKAPPLTIIISVLGIHLLFQRKYIWLLPLMFAFVWTYSLFPLLWFAAIIWAVIIAWNERRFEWRPLAYTTVGMVLGNIINPYFPNNIYLFVEHFTEKFKIGRDFVVAVGGEWYPYSRHGTVDEFPDRAGGDADRIHSFCAPRRQVAGKGGVLSGVHDDPAWRRNSVQSVLPSIFRRSRYCSRRSVGRHLRRRAPSCPRSLSVISTRISTLQRPTERRSMDTGGQTGVGLGSRHWLSLFSGSTTSSGLHKFGL